MEVKKSGYSLGDRVVLPPYGVGVVSGISKRRVADDTLAYYQVDFPNSTSRAFVPVIAPDGTGMRPALTSADMPELLARLRGGRLNLPRQWAARHRKVTEILVSGDPFELASLAAELRRWNIERGLPDLDRQAYRRALKLLEQEVRELIDGEAQHVRALIDSAWCETPN
ncbi:CarD family transcriptional regulator [Deinococcus yavapaiensis KR-236]|uniref:CarD family transcriptional regulator n=1 Tax=Deinococcus yavapaiensis KR-236 TaxID=694435 RepID=A0A318S7T7_9DEIO|nr:CarD family transcriptional regulator [Deinococcus yavapaiensis]PYE51101.1 CarD family transcriptional regulator [Deinococcus yavapaiensis KR-236]